MPNGFGAEHLKAAAAMMAPKHSPHPWHVRLGGYRVGLPITETIPQWLADKWTEVMQEAVEVWARGDTLAPDFEFIDSHDDEMVERRIAGYQVGYDKEWSRRAVGGYWSDFDHEEKGRYIFSDMPMNLKRAIVSLWDGLHSAWMETHPEASYAPNFGYHWRIAVDGVTVKVKMVDYVDKGSPPTKEESENWETMGAPGGMWGWAGAAAAAREFDALWLYVEGVLSPDLHVEGS